MIAKKLIDCRQCRGTGSSNFGRVGASGLRTCRVCKGTRKVPLLTFTAACSPSKLARLTTRSRSRPPE